MTSLTTVGLICDAAASLPLTTVGLICPADVEFVVAKILAGRVIGEAGELGGQTTIADGFAVVMATGSLAGCASEADGFGKVSRTAALIGAVEEC